MSTWFLALLCRAQSFLLHAKNPRLLRTLAMVSTRSGLGYLPQYQRFPLSCPVPVFSKPIQARLTSSGTEFLSSKPRIFFACECLFDFFSQRWELQIALLRPQFGTKFSVLLITVVLPFLNLGVSLGSQRVFVSQMRRIVFPATIPKESHPPTWRRGSMNPNCLHHMH